MSRSTSSFLRTTTNPEQVHSDSPELSTGFLIQPFSRVLLLFSYLILPLTSSTPPGPLKDRDNFIWARTFRPGPERSSGGWSGEAVPLSPLSSCVRLSAEDKRLSFQNDRTSSSAHEAKDVR